MLDELDVMSLAVKMRLTSVLIMTNGNETLILSSVLIAISTALVGPITFFGLIVANLSYQFFATYKHSILILGATLISIVALVGGQFFVATCI